MQAEPAAHLDLAGLCHELRHRYGLSLSYKQVYSRAASGEVPAERAANGRWRIDPTRVPEIAAIVRADTKRRA